MGNATYAAVIEDGSWRLDESDGLRRFGEKWNCGHRHATIHDAMICGVRLALNARVHDQDGRRCA